MTAPAIGHGDLAEELGLVHAAVTRQSAGLLSLANCILHALHIQRLVWDSMTFSAAVSSLSEAIDAMHRHTKGSHPIKTAVSELSNGASLAMLLIVGPSDALMSALRGGSEPPLSTADGVVDAARALLDKLAARARTVSSDEGFSRSPLRSLAAWMHSTFKMTERGRAQCPVG